MNTSVPPSFVHTLDAEKYELVHAFLALLYGAFFLFFLFFLVFRGHFHSRPFFNVLLLTGIMLRGIWLVLQAFLQAGRLSLRHWHDWYFVLNTLPSFFFFSCFFIVLFLWVLVFHTRIRQPAQAPPSYQRHYHPGLASPATGFSASPSRTSAGRLGGGARVGGAAAPQVSSANTTSSNSSSEPLVSYQSGDFPSGSPALTGPGEPTPLAISTSRYRLIFFGANVLMYSTLAVFLVLDYLDRGQTAFHDSAALTVWEQAVMVLEASLYVVSGVGFAVYGALFRSELRRMRSTLVRKRILAKVQRLTFLTVVCFTTRAGIIVWSAMSPKWNTWYFDLCYFGGLELLPLFLIILVLHAGLGSEQTVHIPPTESQKHVQFK